MIYSNSCFAVQSCNAVLTPCFSIPLQLIISASESFGRTTVSILHPLAAINEHVIWGIGSSSPPSPSLPFPLHLLTSLSSLQSHLAGPFQTHTHKHTRADFRYLVASHSSHFFFFFFGYQSAALDVLCMDAALLHHAEQSISERQ